MNRLVTALRFDLRMQQRYGFFYAGLFSLLVWIVVLKALPMHWLPQAVPLVVFLDLAVIGFYFMAGMVLFEKDEGTLWALVVSPLTFREYLTAKLISLSLLALVISIVLIVVTYGLQFNFALAVVAVLTMSLISLLIGFMAVAPFSSLSTFLIPSQLYAVILYLPLVDYFGWWKSVLFYLCPTHGSLLLLQGAFQSMTIDSLIYSIGATTTWIVGLAVLAHRAFDRHIVARAGGL